MLTKMLKNDIMKNKGIHLLLCLFITLAAMLVAGAFGIIVQMMGAMDTFAQAAQPLHYLQMVSEAPDQQALDAFSQDNALVKAQQTLEILNLDNSTIYFAGEAEPHTDSVMENAFTTQSLHFDYLLDENNRPLDVKPGQVAVPLYTAATYGLQKGDTLTIRDAGFEMTFEIVGFVRDFQMNPSLVSSKRFVVSSEDYAWLRQNTGEPEYLVEFMLTDASKTGEFENAYLAAGLPSGIAITLSILQIMNATTGGLPAIVLIMAGLLLVVVAMVCLRFTILTALEDESRQIGVMRAIGLLPKQIRRLYLSKYYLIGVVSCLAGFGLALAFGGLFTQSISFYMGRMSSPVWETLLPLAGAAAVFVLVAWFCGRMLRRLRKVQVVEAIRGTSEKQKKGKTAFPLHKIRFIGVNLALGARDVVNRFRSYSMPIFVFTLCAFLITVPANFLNTLKAPEFASYIGTGYSDLLITLRPAGEEEEAARQYTALMETLQADPDVTLAAGTATVNYKMQNTDGEYENIRVKIGDFTTFPVPYLQGGAPAAQDEIALSYLVAKDLGVGVGDTVTILLEGVPTHLTVSGTYQDMTNGGKSAQALLVPTGEPILWYDISANLAEGADINAKIEWYNDLFPSIQMMGIDKYMDQTFGATIRQMEVVTWVVTGIAAIIAALITALFFKMMLARDAGQIAIMKSLGFRAAHIRTQYTTAFVLCLVLGLTLGTVGAATLGEGLVGMLMASAGTAHIEFIIDPLVTYVATLALLLAAVLATTLITARSIRRQHHITAE